MLLDTIFDDRVDNTVIVNARKDTGSGLLLMPYLAKHTLRFDCHVLERTPSGEVIKSNYESINRSEDFSRWNALAGKYGLSRSGWMCAIPATT